MAKGRGSKSGVGGGKGRLWCAR